MQKRRGAVPEQRSRTTVLDTRRKYFCLKEIETKEMQVHNFGGKTNFGKIIQNTKIIQTLGKDNPNTQERYSKTLFNLNWHL